MNVLCTTTFRKTKTLKLSIYINVIVAQNGRRINKYNHNCELLKHAYSAICLSTVLSDNGLYICSLLWLSGKLWQVRRLFSFFNRFIHAMLHYTVILHVLVYTLLHNDCFPFVLIWMVICQLPTYNICAIYTRNCLVYYSLLKSIDLTKCEKAFKYLATSSLFVGGPNPSSSHMLYHGASLGFQYSACMD